ncbi:MAG: response regulator [Oscillochloris sp.]|nr:response regulator [Oscillochloris sp.]
MAADKDTILIVEDDPAIARVLEIYLSKRGYLIQKASRGEEALAICRTTPPDLVVLDVRLPDISGYEVGKALRATPDTQNIPIVVLTAFGERQNRLEAHDEVRADYFLNKPFDIEEVHSIIRNQLSESRRRGQFHPITNLPTGELVNTRLRALLTSDGWTFALIRVAGFESFTQLYGVVAGEDVLKFTALLLVDVLHRQGAAEDFTGQMVVGPYFMLIAGCAQIEAIISDLKSHFDKDIELYYSYQDRRQASVQRSNGGSTVPLMALTVGVLHSSDGPFRDIRELTEAAEQRLNAESRL